MLITTNAATMTLSNEEFLRRFLWIGKGLLAPKLSSTWNCLPRSNERGLLRFNPGLNDKELNDLYTEFLVRLRESVIAI